MIRRPRSEDRIQTTDVRKQRTERAHLASRFALQPFKFRLPTSQFPHLTSDFCLPASVFPRRGRPQRGGDPLRGRQKTRSPRTARCCLTSVFLLSLILVSGCGPKKEVQAPAATKEAETPINPRAASVQIAAAGTLKGNVFFDGAAPPLRELSLGGNPECSALHPGAKLYAEDFVVNSGLLANVFVYVKEGLEGKTFAPPREPLVLENRKCAYVPHVAGAQVNQPVLLLNSDPALHNVHSYSKNSAGWNVGLPVQGMKITKKFPASEIMVSFRCDVHPWMSAYLGVLPHPFFAVTRPDGSFELTNLPTGEYLIEAWHEKLGTQSQHVALGPQETKEIEFRFKTQ